MDRFEPTRRPPEWEGLFLLAKVIPRLCHNINRVVYVFGGKVDRRISQVRRSAAPSVAFLFLIM
jgi:GMP synthase (glutamine-hydrolysing)